MNTKLFAAAVAVVLAIPAVASAQQSSSGITRAQVRAELVQIEQAGYNPSRANDPHYPADVQAAAARLQVADNTIQPDATSGYGGTADQSSQSGHIVTVRPAERSIYFGR